MTYYIDPIWFYLMGVSDGLRFVCILVGTILAIVGIICVINLASYCNDDEQVMYRKTRNLALTLATILILTGVAIPNKETCIQMMVASVVTKENVDMAKDDIYSFVDYTIEKIKEVKDE